MRLHPTDATTALILSAVCIFAALPAVAQPARSPAAAAPKVDTSGPAWNTLSPAQRQALAPLEREWPSIDSVRKSKWLEIAARLPSMPPDERRRMQERMSEWARLTPDERGRARLSFQEAKQLSPRQRQERWEAYQALPEEDRKALANRAQQDKPQSVPVPPAAKMLAAPRQPPPAAASSPGVIARPAAPTVVQARPGATTTLMTRVPSPPPHQKAGQPKIEAQPGKVDRTTLLPQRGPQGAATRAAPPAASAASRG
jgi:hypothetical protein